MKLHLSALALATTLLASSFATTANEGFGVGAGAFYGSTEYKDIDSKVYFIPVLSYEGENFSLSPTRAEYHFSLTNNLWLSAIAALRLQGYEEEDSKVFQGMKDRDIGIDAGLSLNYYQQDFGYLALELLTDISETAEGDELSAIYAFPIEGQGISITPMVFVTWRSKELIDYYYGVRENEVTANRAFYQGDAATSYGAAVALDYDLGDNFTLFSELRTYSLSDEVKDSPLIDDDKSFAYGVSMGVIYNF